MGGGVAISYTVIVGKQVILPWHKGRFIPDLINFPPLRCHQVRAAGQWELQEGELRLGGVWFVGVSCGLIGSAVCSLLPLSSLSLPPHTHTHAQKDQV